MKPNVPTTVLPPKTGSYTASRTLPKPVRAMVPSKRRIRFEGLMLRWMTGGERPWGDVRMSARPMMWCPEPHLVSLPLELWADL